MPTDIPINWKKIWVEMLGRLESFRLPASPQQLKLPKEALEQYNQYLQDACLYFMRQCTQLGIKTFNKSLTPSPNTQPPAQTRAAPNEDVFSWSTESFVIGTAVLICFVIVVGVIWHCYKKRSTAGSNRNGKYEHVEVEYGPQATNSDQSTGNVDQNVSDEPTPQATNKECTGNSDECEAKYEPMCSAPQATNSDQPTGNVDQNVYEYVESPQHTRGFTTMIFKECTGNSDECEAKYEPMYSAPQATNSDQPTENVDQNVYEYVESPQHTRGFTTMIFKECTGNSDEPMADNKAAQIPPNQTIYNAYYKPNADNSMELSQSLSK